MKKLLIALLLLPSLAWGQEYARMNPYILGSGVSAAACSAPAGNIIRENFASTPDHTWTAVILTPTYGHALQTGAPSGSCDTGLNLVLTSTANRERIHTPTVVAADATVDITFSIYFNSFSLGSGDAVNIVSLHEDNEGGANQIFLWNDTGTYKMRGFGTTAGNATTVTTGTWYTATLHLDATPESSYFQLTGGESTGCDLTTDCPITRYTAGGASTHLVIGKTGYASREADFEIGYITVNTP